MLQLSLPRCKLGFVGSSLLILGWAGQRDYGEWVCASSKHCPCSQWNPIYHPSYQCLDSGKTETSTSGSLLKSLNIGQMLGVSYQWCSAVLGGGTMASKCHKSSYWLHCCLFYVCLGYRSLLTGFWISHKGNWSMYYIVRISFGKRRIWGSLCILSSCRLIFKWPFLPLTFKTNI